MDTIDTNMSTYDLTDMDKLKVMPTRNHGKSGRPHCVHLSRMRDMPAHIKSMLTASSLSIPVIDQQLALGVWQGVYCWEHRHSSKQRTIIVHLGP